jgi:hypothetical protein
MTPLIVGATLLALGAVTLLVRQLRHVGGIATNELVTLAVATVIYTAGVELNLAPLIGIGILTLIAGCARAATPPRGDQLDPVDAILATAPTPEYDIDGQDPTPDVVPAEHDRLAVLEEHLQIVTRDLVQLAAAVETNDELMAAGIRDLQRRLGAA